AVLLETRCDGSAHGGCQAGCTILWKEAWLKPVAENATVTSAGALSSTGDQVVQTSGCSELQLWSRTQIRDQSGGPSKYVCQMTDLPGASPPLAWWDFRQYVEDVWSGNVSLFRLIVGASYALYYNISHAGIGVGPMMRWLYDALRWTWRGSRFPRTPGRI